MSDPDDTTATLEVVLRSGTVLKFPVEIHPEATRSDFKEGLTAHLAEWSDYFYGYDLHGDYHFIPAGSVLHYRVRNWFLPSEES